MYSLDVVGERAADRAEFQQSCKLVSFMIKCTWALTRATGQVFSFKDLSLIVIHQYSINNSVPRWEHIFWVSTVPALNSAAVGAPEEG